MGQSLKRTVVYYQKLFTFSCLKRNCPENTAKITVFESYCLQYVIFVLLRLHWAQIHKINCMKSKIDSTTYVQIAYDKFKNKRNK